MKTAMLVLMLSMIAPSAFAAYPSASGDAALREIEFLAKSLNVEFVDLDLQIPTQLNSPQAKALVLDELNALKGQLLHNGQGRAGEFQMLKCTRVECSSGEIYSNPRATQQP